MLSWLIGVAVCVLIWGVIWKKSISLGFGILVGVLGAWLVARLIEPYVTGMEEIPLWLPPLPMATIAVLLIVYGAVVWIRGNEALPKPKQDDDHHRSA
jgi:hypothetical protein